MSEEIVLLVIGYWGNGKSTSANTILGSEAFSKNNSTVPVVTVPTWKKSSANKITLVDGLCLWGKDPTKLDQDTLFDAQTAVEKCGRGFNAILMVLRYGEKYSEEEAKLVTVAKVVFGPKIFEEFGVCLITHGDDFKYAVENGEEPCKSFQEWCKKQSGSLNKLFNDCGRRCVLFDNREKDPNEKRNLLKIVYQLSIKGTKRYSMKDFQKCHGGRQFSASPSKRLESKFVGELDVIRDQLKTNSSKSELQMMLENLRDLSEKISQGLKDRPQIESLIFEAQKLTRIINALLEKSSVADSKDPISARPDMSDRSSHVIDKDHDSLKFNNGHFNQEADTHGKEKTIEADQRMSEFRKKLESNSFGSDAAMIKHNFDIMKRQVMGIVNSTAYFDHFKSKIEQLEKEVEKKLGPEWNNSNSNEENQDTKQNSSQSKENPDSARDIDKESGDLKLLILGSSGNGKSSTGNSIIGRHVFQISSSTAATKSIIANETQSFQDFSVSVVDGPSLDDVVLDKTTDLDNMLASIKEALQLCDYGFHGLLIVLKFGQRFTKQEKDAVVMIKSILGKDVVKKYGVCVMTHGDNYEYEINEDKPVDFIEWCREQTGEIAELYKDCSYRCVLFDNKTRDEQTKINQRKQLLDFINKEQKYSEEEFLDAEEDFKDLTIQCVMPLLEQATSTYLSKIRDKLQQIELEMPNHNERYKEELDTMLHALQEYITNIKTLGNHPTIEYLIQLVSTLQLQINSKLRLCQQTEELKQLDAERHKLHENLTNPNTPIRMSQEAQLKYHVLPVDPRLTQASGETFPASSSRAALGGTSICTNFETRQHIDEMNLFLEDINLRVSTANTIDPLNRLKQKRRIIQDIDRRLEKAAMRGERNVDLDHICAQLIHIKENLRLDFVSERNVLPAPHYSEKAITSVPIENDFQLVYPHPEYRSDAYPAYPYLNAPQVGYISTNGHGQHHQQYLCDYYDSSPGLMVSNKKIKKKEKRWTKIKRELKKLVDFLDPFN